MLIKTYAAAVFGIEATPVTVEVNISGGTKYYMVGLPDNAVKESLRRVESALTVSGFRMPRQKIVINFAPADIRKEGTAYDLAIALAILGASQQIEVADLERFLILGELSLDGGIHPVKGVLPIALRAIRDGFTGLLLPASNAREAAVVEGLRVYGVTHLREAIGFLNRTTALTPTQVDVQALLNSPTETDVADFADVNGQENIKRALEIAAAGGHHAILIGPPGSGKTMLAKRLPSILPPLSLGEALETTKIHSVAGKLKAVDALVTARPFRDPHHTISDIALVGGGATPQPGEISLAHNGVLFLDELPEFKRSVLEVLRQPLESRAITISRARMAVSYPANFILMAAMNPCPCGFHNHPQKACTCLPSVVHKYLNRVSGPLLDRIDLQVEVTPVAFREMASAGRGESSAAIRQRVVAARQRQLDRYTGLPIYCNAQLDSRQVREQCRPDRAGRTLLETAINRLGLSARAYDRILRVARTIADLEAAETIGAAHLAEAIQFRSLDRSNWSVG